MGATPTNSSPTVFSRLSQFFFTHIGTYVAVFLYFDIAGRAQFTVAGVQAGLSAGIVVMSGYMAHDNNEIGRAHV